MSRLDERALIARARTYPDIRGWSIADGYERALDRLDASEAEAQRLREELEDIRGDRKDALAEAERLRAWLRRIVDVYAGVSAQTPEYASLGAVVFAQVALEGEPADYEFRPVA